MVRYVLRLALVASFGIQVLGQAPPTTPPTFEVASIKRNVSGDPARGRTEAGGRFTATSAPILQFIRLAYDNLTTDRILNVPDWVTSERYDLVAKAPEGAGFSPPAGVGPFMRSLLRDRFGFEAHFEMRDMPTYELVLARRDGRLGAKLQQASCDCTGNRAETGCRRGAPLLSSPEFGGMACALLGIPGRNVMHGYPIATFAQGLAGRVERVVVDKTGLTGTWNAELEFTPDQPPPSGQGLGIAPPPGDAPSLFTALQEQLGLKMQPSRGPVEVLVIDHIERPAPD